MLSAKIACPAYFDPTRREDLNVDKLLHLGNTGRWLDDSDNRPRPQARTPVRLWQRLTSPIDQDKSW